MSALLTQMRLDGATSIWPLAGSGVDVVGGRNGTVNGAVSAPTGLLPALDFDGVDDDVVVSHDASLNPTDLTVSCWVNLDAIGGTLQSPISKVSGSSNWAWQMLVWTDGSVSFDLLSATSGSIFRRAQSPVGTAIVGKWTLLAGTYLTSGTLDTMFVDGVSVATATTGTGSRSLSSNAPLSIGRRGDPTKYPLNGRISHAAIFPSALAAARVKAHYEAGIRSGVVVG